MLKEPIRILLLQKDWGYAQFLAGTIQETLPQAIVHIVTETSRAATQTEDSSYSLAILDSDEGIDAVTALATNIVAKTPETKVLFLLAPDVPKSAIEQLRQPQIQIAQKPLCTGELRHLVMTHI